MVKFRPRTRLEDRSHLLVTSIKTILRLAASVSHAFRKFPVPLTTKLCQLRWTIGTTDCHPISRAPNRKLLMTAAVHQWVYHQRRKNLKTWTWTCFRCTNHTQRQRKSLTEGNIRPNLRPTSRLQTTSSLRGLIKWLSETLPRTLAWIQMEITKRSGSSETVRSATGRITSSRTSCPRSATSLRRRLTQSGNSTCRTSRRPPCRSVTPWVDQTTGRPVVSSCSVMTSHCPQGNTFCLGIGPQPTMKSVQPMSRPWLRKTNGGVAPRITRT